MKRIYQSMTKSGAEKGVATIPIVLAFGILTVTVALGITALSLNETLSSQGSYQSMQALGYAEAGGRDALERIARNKAYTCAATDCYTIDLALNGCSTNLACAKVIVSAGIGTTSDPKIITSKGQAGLNVRTLQSGIIFDAASYGQIASTTWVEITN